MTFFLKSFFDKISAWLISNRLRENVIFFVLSFLISIPVFIYFRKNIYYFDAEIPYDKILVFIMLLFLFFFILKSLRKKIIYSIIIYVITFALTSIQGKYSLFQVITAYKIIFLSKKH
jgi:hypothetical protein